MAALKLSSIPWIVTGVEELVQYHVNHPNTPCLLAVWYDMDDVQNVKLFEVLQDWVAIEDEGQLEVLSFPGSRDFPLPPGGSCLLLVANPSDAQKALKMNAGSIQPVRQSIEAGTASLIYSAPGNPEVEEIVKALNLDQ